MRSSSFQLARHSAIWLGLLGLASGSPAADFSYSGFATVAAGKVISGTQHEAVNDYHCPCFIADYGQGALYGPHWSVGQESKVGLQATYKITPTLSATGQIVGRGVDGIKADVEWAYLSYELTPSWTLQAGRKRLPLYFYSEFQDVGYAFYWTRLPTDLYGWEIVNYNGVNATYRGNWGGWAAKSNVFTGGENTKNNRYSTIYYASPQDVSWKNIMGADLELTHDWLTLRFNYITSNVQQWDKTDGVRPPLTPDPARNRSAERQNIYGAALNIDYNDWLFRSEYSVFDRSGYSYRSRAFMMAAGYHIGDFTPMVTVSRYGEHNTFTPDAVQVDKGLSLSLRYDINNNSDIKIQMDHFKDLSGPDSAPHFVGSSKLISVSYDTVF